MKSLAPLFIVLTLTSCVHHHLNLSSPHASTPITYSYWYSAQEKNNVIAVEKVENKNYVYSSLFVMVNGKKEEYTECQLSTKYSRPVGRFNDFKFVVTTSSGPCSPKNGEY